MSSGLFRLSCPLLVQAIDQLEDEGGIEDVNARLASDESLREVVVPVFRDSCLFSVVVACAGKAFSTFQTLRLLITGRFIPSTFGIDAAPLFGVSASSACTAGWWAECGVGFHGGEPGAWSAAAAFGDAGQDECGGRDHRQAGSRPLPRQRDHRCHPGEGETTMTRHDTTATICADGPANRASRLDHLFGRSKSALGLLTKPSWPLLLGTGCSFPIL